LGGEVHGPYNDLEIVQLVLKTDFILRRGHAVERLLSTWERDCRIGVQIGKEWFERGKLQTAISKKNDLSMIID
jgi:tRNA(adenine34) deaminase